MERGRFRQAQKKGWMGRGARAQGGVAAGRETRREKKRESVSPLSLSQQLSLDRGVECLNRVFGCACVSLCDLSHSAGAKKGGRMRECVCGSAKARKSAFVWVFFLLLFPLRALPAKTRDKNKQRAGAKKEQPKKKDNHGSGDDDDDDDVYSSETATMCVCVCSVFV